MHDGVEPQPSTWNIFVSKLCHLLRAVFAGTLTQNDMQVVRMWIGGSDYHELNELQPLPPGLLFFASYMPLLPLLTCYT